MSFEKDPVSSSTKMHPRDPLEEFDLGDRTSRRSMYISANIEPDLRLNVINLLQEFRDYYSWDYNEILGLSRELMELKLRIKPGKNLGKQIPRRFAP